jgi:hypothetical protein
MNVYYAHSGIDVNAKFVTMNNCNVSYCHNYGIRVSNSYTGLTSISNTTLFENDYDGMIILANAIVNGDGVISSSNGRHGFNITSSVNVTFDNSRAIGNTEHGVLITDAVVSFDNSDISENILDGFYVTGAAADLTVDHSNINDNHYMGLYFETSSTGTVTWSKITGNYSAGVWIQSEADPTVNYCNIYGNATSPSTYIYTEDIPTNQLYIQSTNGSSSNYTIMFPANKISQARLSGYMDHYSSSSDYQMWLYDANSVQLATYSRQNTSSDTNFDTWFTINTTSTSTQLKVSVYGYYQNSGTPWARCSQLKYDLTSYMNDFVCVNKTATVNAQYNWWGQITGVNGQVIQLVNGLVSYTNLQSADLTTAGCTVTNIGPGIQLLTPTELVYNPTTYTLNWQDIDVDDNSSISLYYDKEQDFTGTMFAENIQENSTTDSYTWNFTNVPHDIYYIYAVIDDGVNPPVMDYAPGRIMVGPLSAGISEDIQGGATETIAVPVYIINSIPEYNILSFQFTITYDFTLLTAIDVETDATLTENWSVNYNAGTVGTIEINGFNTTPLQTGGTLLYVNMLVASDADDYDNCQLNFTNFTFNEDAEAVVQHNGLFTVYNTYDITGAVTYYSGTLPIPGVTIDLSGDKTDNTTSLTNGTYQFNNVLTGNYLLIPSTGAPIPTLTITPYDAAITARYALGLDVFTANQILAADVSGNGSASVYDSALMAQYALGLITELPAGDWLFSPVQTAVEIFGSDETANFSGIVIGDPSGNYPGSVERAVEFNTQQIVLNPDSNGNYILSINADREFLALTGSINFRPEELTLVGANYSGMMSEFNVEEAVNEGNVKLSAWNTASANTGEILQLVFSGNGIDPQTIEIEYFILDETVGGTFSAPTAGEGNEIQPINFALNGNHPNPFNPETAISFSVPATTNVRIEIYNIRGEKVKSLVNDTYTTGTHSVVWNGTTDSGKSVASGIYFYRMEAGKYSATRKMALLK